MDTPLSTPELLYSHRQIGSAMRLLAFLPAVCLALVVALTPGGTGHLPGPLLVVIAVITVIVLVDSAALTITLTRERLSARFGLGLIRKTVPLARVAGVEVIRTTWLDGWGIHWTRRGVLWNIAGRDAVRLRLAGNRYLVLGSDEAERLAAAIDRALDERRSLAHQAGH